jgi:uncharacterized protein YbjT (DUF2867 family)
MEGPIAITGASGQIGRALVRRLAAFPNTVRALGRDDDLVAAFRDAGAVVHLAGTLRPEWPSTLEDANLRTVEATVAALDRSSVERVVFLSYVGADTRSDNEYLRAKAEAEELLHRSGRDYVVFRCTHIFGPPAEPGPTVSALLADAGRAVWVLGTGTQRIAPVFRDDVVEAIVAALEPTAYHGRFDLAGPEVLAMDEFVELVNGGRARLRHVPPLAARALAHAAPGNRLTPELVEIMLADSVGDPTRAARVFGLELRSVRDVYGAAAARAA